MIGNGGGVVYAPLGPTHMAIEDIAIMRALPNMTVVAVCDAEEMKRFMRVSPGWPHPIYIRLAKGGDPVVSRPENGFEIGKAITMRAARSRRPVVIMATGVMTTNALKAAEFLEKQGIDTSVLHFHTVKPLDEVAVREDAENARLIVTAEEGVAIGSFGSAITDSSSRRADIPARDMRLALPDEFPKKYGSQNDHFEIYGLSAPQIAASVGKHRQARARRLIRRRSRWSAARFRAGKINHVVADRRRV